MKLVVLFFLFAVSYVVSQQKPVFLCGRELARTRELLCFAAGYVDKRSSPLSLMSELDEDKSVEVEWPWSEQRGALSANLSRYKRGGLVDECCLKPCTSDVVLAYC